MLWVGIYLLVGLLLLAKKSSVKATPTEQWAIVVLWGPVMIALAIILMTRSGRKAWAETGNRIANQRWSGPGPVFRITVYEDRKWRRKVRVTSR